MPHTRSQRGTTTLLEWPMDWKPLLVATARFVDEELRLRNAYLVAENHLLCNQLKGYVRLPDAERKTLAEIGQKLGKQALEEIATIAKGDSSPGAARAWP